MDPVQQVAIKIEEEEEAVSWEVINRRTNFLERVLAEQQQNIKRQNNEEIATIATKKRKITPRVIENIISHPIYRDFDPLDFLAGVTLKFNLNG